MDAIDLARENALLKARLTEVEAALAEVQEANRRLEDMLIRDDAGSNATETRWNCKPLPATAADSTLHQWTPIKNKKGTMGS